MQLKRKKLELIELHEVEAAFKTRNEYYFSALKLSLQVNQVSTIFPIEDEEEGWIHTCCCFLKNIYSVGFFSPGSSLRNVTPAPGKQLQGVKALWCALTQSVFDMSHVPNR